MSRKLVHLAVIALTLEVTGSCTPFVSRTPVRGDPTAIAQLVGEWEGTYASVETGRSGSIVFRLRAGTDTAEGDVLITSGREGQMSDADPGRPPQHREPLVVGVRFVLVAGTQVRGALDSYRDPDCGCRLMTTFHGTLAGGIIEGTFTSEGEGIHHLPASGTWRVTRRR